MLNTQRSIITFTGVGEGNLKGAPGTRSEGRRLI